MTAARWPRSTATGSGGGRRRGRSRPAISSRVVVPVQSDGGSAPRSSHQGVTTRRRPKKIHNTVCVGADLDAVQRPEQGGAEPGRDRSGAAGTGQGGARAGRSSATRPGGGSAVPASAGRSSPSRPAGRAGGRRGERPRRLAKLGSAARWPGRGLRAGPVDAGRRTRSPRPGAGGPGLWSSEARSRGCGVEAWRRRLS